MKPLSLGIIGCGNVLGAYKAALLPLVHQGRVYVSHLCGRAGQSEAAVQGLGEKVTFHTSSEPVLKSRDVDAVLILTSMPEHAALTRAALKSGKHVLVEKTMAATVEEAQELIALAHRQGLLLMAAPFTTLSPTWLSMARCLQQGGIGTPCSARARYGWAGPDWSEWFYKPGGGCLFDLGVYSLTTLTGLLGPARRVTAMTGICQPTRTIRGRKIRVQAEDNAQIILDFGRSCFASIMTGFTLQQYRGPALEIYGTTGTIQMLGDDWDPDGYEWWENQVGAWKVFKETQPDWSWTEGLTHFVDCLQTHRKPRTSIEQACHVIEIMRAAQRSSREGRTVKLTTDFICPRLPREAEHEKAHLMHDRSRHKPDHSGPAATKRQKSSKGSRS